MTDPGRTPDSTGEMSSLPPLRWSAKLLALPPGTLALAVVVIAIARSGIGFYASDLPAIAESFPVPVNGYRGVSVLSPMIGGVLGLTAPAEWSLLHLLFVAGLLGAMVVATLRAPWPGGARSFVLVALLASGIPVVLLAKVGFYDVWMIAGAVAIGAGRRWPTAVVGGLLVGATNVEQGLAALAALLVVMLILDRSAVLRLAVALVGLVVSRGAIALWYSAYDVELISRAELVVDRIPGSVQGFLDVWPVQIFSWYSAAWVVVLSLIFAAGTSLMRRLGLLAGLIGVPAVAAVITYDGTRVFVGVSAAAFAFAVVWMARRSEDLGQTPVTDGLARLTLATMMVTPGLMTWVGGEVQAPWASLLSRLGVELGAG